MLSLARKWAEMKRKKIKCLGRYSIILLFLSSLHGSCSQPSTQCPSVINGVKNEPYVGSSLEDKQLSLGIDIESVQVAEEVSNVLNQMHLKVVFFIDGKEIGKKGTDGKLRNIINSGHRLANIGYSRQEIVNNRNLEIQFRSVDYILTRIQNDSLFFLRFVDNDWTKAKILNEYGMGKYIGPLGNAAEGLSRIGENYCEKSSQEQNCEQEFVSYIQAVRKGFIVVSKLPVVSNFGDFIGNIVRKLQQSGYQFVGLTEIPEISREITIREDGRKNQRCDDYSRN